MKLETVTANSNYVQAQSQAWEGLAREFGEKREELYQQEAELESKLYDVRTRLRMYSAAIEQANMEAGVPKSTRDQY